MVGSGLRIFTKLYCSNDQALGAMIYFITCASIFIVGTILFYLSLHTEFARHHINKNREHDSHQMSLSYFVTIFKKLATPSITIFIIFFVTCTIFPVLIIDIKAYQYTILNNDRWMTVLITFIFAVGDYISRQVVLIKVKMKELLKLAIMRFLIAIPIGVMFYASIWNHDIGLFIFTSILALTHGEFACYGFMKYGESLEINEQETGAAIMEFFLSMGIASAGLAASFIDYIIQYLKPQSNILGDN